MHACSYTYYQCHVMEDACMYERRIHACMYEEENTCISPCERRSCTCEHPQHMSHHHTHVNVAAVPVNTLLHSLLHQRTPVLHSLLPYRRSCTCEHQQHMYDQVSNETQTVSKETKVYAKCQKSPRNVKRDPEIDLFKSAGDRRK